MMSDNAQRAPRSAEMTAMVLRTDRSIGLERRPVPTPRDDQVLVDIDLCGICGSDLHCPRPQRSTSAASSWGTSPLAGSLALDAT